MSEAYRVNRVPVTDKIRDKIIELITNEDDIATKKKHPAKWYRTETATGLKLSENANPSLRSYEDLVNETRQYLKKQNPLDDPWSFGSLINYPIPQDKIIEVWTLCENLRTGGPIIDIPLNEGGTESSQWYKNRGVKWLTIRQVRWYVILRSIPLGFEGNSLVSTSEFHIRNALANALMYTAYERRCEVTERRMITIGMDADTLEKMNGYLYDYLSQVGDIFEKMM